MKIIWGFGFGCIEFVDDYEGVFILLEEVYFYSYFFCIGCVEFEVLVFVDDDEVGKDDENEMQGMFLMQVVEYIIEGLCKEICFGC